MTEHEIPCPECDGDGWYADHDCDGTVDMCARRCPVQVQCFACYGEGVVDPRAVSGDDA